MGARDVGPWVVEPNPPGKTPFGINPGQKMTYLPTYYLPYRGSYPQLHW